VYKQVNGKIENSMKKLPFEITPQIHRYLKELSDFYDEFYVEETKKVFILHTYKNEEKPTAKNENNIFYFVDYLKEIGALKDVGKSPFAIKPKEETGLNEDFYYTEYFTLEILDIKQIRALLRNTEVKEKTRITTKNMKRLIMMDGEGDFVIGKDNDPVAFKSKSAGYYKVFVAIYKLTSGTGGHISYKKISEYIKIHFKDKEMTIKNIQNHINNSIKRRYLEKRTPDGKEIISTDSEGKEIIFYNPVING